MTVHAATCPAAAPTAFERGLLRLSAALAALAQRRIRRRAALAHRHALLVAVADAQRDAAALRHIGMLPR